MHCMLISLIGRSVYIFFCILQEGYFGKVAITLGHYYARILGLNSFILGLPTSVLYCSYFWVDLNSTDLMRPTSVHSISIFCVLKTLYLFSCIFQHVILMCHYYGFQRRESVFFANISQIKHQTCIIRHSVIIRLYGH